MLIYFRLRHSKLQNCFSVHNSGCNCSNTHDLFHGLRSEHNPAEWRQFIDSSKASVLLNKGNHLSLAPFAHAAGLKENYETVELVLHLIMDSVYDWNICRDLEVIGLLLGVQMGYSKHKCFCVVGTARMINSIIFKKTVTHLKSFLARFIMFLYLIPPKYLRQYKSS